MTFGSRGRREMDGNLRSLSGEEFAGGGVDKGALGDGKGTEQRSDGTGIGDAAESDGGVEDAHGVDFVAQIFQGLEDAAEAFGFVPVSSAAGFKHGGGKARGDTAAAGGEAREFSVAQVLNDGLLAHTANNHAWIDQAGQFG